MLSSLTISRNGFVGDDIEIEGKISITNSYDKSYRRKTGAIFRISRRFLPEFDENRRGGFSLKIGVSSASRIDI